VNSLPMYLARYRDAVRPLFEHARADRQITQQLDVHEPPPLRVMLQIQVESAPTARPHLMPGARNSGQGRMAVLDRCSCRRAARPALGGKLQRATWVARVDRISHRAEGCRVRAFWRIEV
jgi:hypothetical protein